MVSNILSFLEKRSKDFIAENNKFSEDFYSDELKNSTKKLIQVLSEFHGFDVEKEFNKNYEIAVRQHRAKNPITISQSKTLKINAPEWLTKERMITVGWGADEVNTFRDRYLKYLLKIGRSKQLIEETSRSTLSIVKNLGDPESTEGFYKKGMVVGSVQSGKTANFNGVINTAVDTGYKIVIVLSGLMEDLRVQTQKRIEKDVIGPLGAKNGHSIPPTAG
jgi:vacuolar-type H+-ATPase subunit F/Vma7